MSSSDFPNLPGVRGGDASSVTPEAAGSSPEQSGATPEQSATTPEQSAAAPEPAGASPEQSGATPAERGDTAAESDATPEQSAAAPEPAGATRRASGRSGSGATRRVGARSRAHDVDPHHSLYGLPRLITVAGVGLSIVLLLLIVFAHAYYVRRQVDVGSRLVAAAAGRLVTQVGPEFVSAQSEHLLEHLLHGFSDYRSIDSVAIYTSDGRLLVGQGGFEHPSQLSWLDRFDVAELLAGIHAADPRGRLVYLQSFVPRHDPIEQGADNGNDPATASTEGAGPAAAYVVAVYADQPGFRSMIRMEMLGLTAFSAGMFVVFFIMLFLLLRREVFTPLRRFTHAVRDDDIDRIHEIARQTRSVEFHSMIASFLANMLTERHRSETLEKAVREKTNSLRKSMERLRETQATLISQEKLASVGRLAAGVAHEINNPSGYVKSNLETLSEYLQVIEERAQLSDRLAHLVEHAGTVPGAEELLAQLQKVDFDNDMPYIREDITELLSASIGGMDRINAIIRGLTAFSRTTDGVQKSLVDLGASLQAAMEIVQNELKYDYNVDFELQSDVSVEAVAGQLEQVFVNILINARDATPPGGEITVRMFTKGDTAVVTISDTGSGIAEEHLDKIFDPFFTTKPVGSGTGLGLSVTQQIVQGNGGDITVTSDLGKGTTFEVRFPVSAAAMPPA